MNARWLGLALIGLGAALITASVITGEASVAVVLIFPVIYGGGVLLLGGIVCIMVGFMASFFMAAGRDDATERGATEEDAGAKAGGVLMIGPVPIIFGSDRRMALVAAAIALTVMAFMMILMFSHP
jgi:uncharacterized protein (TIGR00304 family)